MLFRSRSYIGEHAYEGRVAIVMRDRGLSEEGARSYIGEHAYEGRVAIVMRDRGLSEEGARSYIGEHAYEGRVAIVMRDRGLSEEGARSYIGEHAYEGRVNNVMRDRGLSEEGARSYIGRHAYDGRVNNVMRDHGLSEEAARTHIGHTCYAATILAIMGFFGCNEKKARSMFAESGGKAKGKITRIDDERKECTIEGCNRIQERLTNPLCKKCKAIKRKSEETEVKIKRCVMCGRTDDEYTFSTKEYCAICYHTEAGKKHRADRKKEMFVLCSVPGCTCKASKGGKCVSCYKGSH